MPLATRACSRLLPPSLASAPRAPCWPHPLLQAEAAGVKEIYIDDLREEFVRDFVFPMFR